MAETTVQANNAAVGYLGRRKMPVESRAQNAAMHAAKEGRSTLGIPKKVGAKFVKESRGLKIKKLPAHVRKAVRHAKRRGLISEAAAKKHLGEE